MVTDWLPLSDGDVLRETDALCEVDDDWLVDCVCVPDRVFVSDIELGGNGTDRAWVTVEDLVKV